MEAFAKLLCLAADCVDSSPTGFVKVRIYVAVDVRAEQIHPIVKAAAIRLRGGLLMMPPDRVEGSQEGIISRAVGLNPAKLFCFFPFRQGSGSAAGAENTPMVECTVASVRPDFAAVLFARLP